MLTPPTRAAVPTGLVFELPSGFEAQVRPRSALRRNTASRCSTARTIDSDYRGEVKVLLVNLGEALFDPARHRTAQVAVTPVSRVEIVTVETVTETGRGQGGFGSTGSGA